MSSASQVERAGLVAHENDPAFSSLSANPAPSPSRRALSAGRLRETIEAHKVGFMALGIGLLVVVVLSIAISQLPKSPVAPRPSPGRLPGDVVPLAQRIRLSVDYQNFTVAGVATIVVQGVRDTSQVVLHAGTSSLAVTAVRASLQNKAFYEVPGFSRDAEYDFLTIPIRGRLTRGVNMTIEVSWRANVTTALGGFYRSSYDEAGRQEWLMVTDFEPTQAREAFPCFDEPAYKARFTVVLESDAGLNYLSNMPERSSELVPGNAARRVVTFQESVPMSTYLVAWSLNKFKSVEAVVRSPDGQHSTLIRVWGRPSSLSQLDFALSVATYALPFYEDLFGIRYPLPKQDLVAVPNFEAGAMENWGMITFRETALLYSNASSSVFDKQWVANVIDHELSHQWFGNLVSPEWWDSIFLNEGFASFMESKPVAAQFPEMRMADEFILDNVAGAMAQDGYDASHPILADRATLSTTEGIFTLFDGISYDKGSCLLAMVEAFVGRDVFYGGVHDYLLAHAYGNAEPSALWSAITARAKGSINVAQVAETFVAVQGYPVVTAQAAADGSVALSQRVFRYTGPPAGAAGVAAWTIPLAFSTKAGGAQAVLFRAPQDFRAVGRVAATCDSQLLLNPSHKAYALVQYDPALLACVLQRFDPAHPQRLPTVDRVGVLHDLQRLTFAGSFPPSSQAADVFEALRFLASETEYSFWAMASSAVTRAHDLLQRAGKAEALEALRAWARRAVAGASDSLGWDGSVGTFEQRKLRPTVQSLAVLVGHPGAVANATALFAAYQAGKAPVSPDLRGVVYRAGLQAAPSQALPQTFAFLEAQYLAEADPAERLTLLRAMGSVPSAQLRQTYLGYILDEAKMRSQDIGSAFQAVARASPEGNTAAATFFCDNWAAVVARFQARSVIPRIFPTLVDDKLAQLCFSKNLKEPTPESKRALESINANKRWIDTQTDLVTDWLKKH
jgi:aminopeptidase N